MSRLNRRGDNHEIHKTHETSAQTYIQDVAVIHLVLLILFFPSPSDFVSLVYFVVVSP
jgi:hypothetical protein